MKKKNSQKYKAPGFDSIDAIFAEIYPVCYKNYATIMKWRFGGKDPLDTISVYDGGDFWHFVTYGLTELYDKESDDPEVSGYGMEFTFKLKKSDYEDEEAELMCICGILQSLARITFENGECFYPYEYVYTGQTQGIDSRQLSNITGFITIPDTTVQPVDPKDGHPLLIDTPNGKMQFVEFIGATDRELKAVCNEELTPYELYKKIGSDITDYNRESVV